MTNLLAVSDWYLEIKRFVSSMDAIAYIAIIGTLSILFLAILKYIVKNLSNVNVIKRNVAMPIVIAVLSIMLIIFLLSVRFI